MVEYRNIEYPTQIIEAQQETDLRWTCLLSNGTYFTLPNEAGGGKPAFSSIYELNT